MPTYTVKKDGTEVVPVTINIEKTRRLWARDHGIVISDLVTTEIDRLMIADGSGNLQPPLPAPKKKGKQ